jgi:glutathione transport system substrate-binding protein
VTITPMESGTFDSSVYQPADKNKGQMILFGFSPSNGATDWALRAELSTVAWPPALFNVSFYSNPQVDKLLGDAERTTDAGQRNAYYKQIQEIVFKDAPWIWLAEPTDVWGVSTKVANAYVLPDQTVQVQYAEMH